MINYEVLIPSEGFALIFLSRFTELLLATELDALSKSKPKENSYVSNVSYIGRVARCSLVSIFKNTLVMAVF